MTKDPWDEALCSGEVDHKADLLFGTRHNTATEFQLAEVLLSTDLGAVLHTDEASVVASFLEPDWATVNDLDAIGANEATADGLRRALYVDAFSNANFDDMSNFAYYGFRHTVVTEKLWQPFLLAAANSKPRVLMNVFCSLTHSPQILKEMFSEEMLETLLASNIVHTNILGIAAGKTLKEPIDYVSKVKAFVTPEFFNKLATGRQYYGWLPLHQCICAIQQKAEAKVPTVDFLRSLLPDDARIANQLDLSYDLRYDGID